METAFGQYDEVREPEACERAVAWSTAIGLQQVDGLEVSDYLRETARRHVAGEITQAEAGELIASYYETKSGQAQPAGVAEADKVSRRICEVLASPGFRLSPEYFLGLHGVLFQDVFDHAGRVREVELTKREWVLDGDTVHYTPAFLVKESLAYDFAQEREFRYAGLSVEAQVAHLAAFIAGVWQIHPFREGNTRTTAVFVIQYLRALGYAAENALFQEKAWFFRNALVRANYANAQRGVDRTLGPLEDFLKVLLLGANLELKSRALRIETKREAGQ